MMTFLCFVLTIIVAVAIYYLIRFARIILLIEDELSDAIAVLERSDNTLGRILETPLFADSPAVNSLIREALDDVKICRAATQRIVESFTRLSKQQYERAEYEEGEGKGRK